MIIVKYILCFAMVILIYSNTIAAEYPLGFVMPYNWADFTSKQKELYVSGVIDGQIFMLYGASSPELKPFLECVKNEGIKTIVNQTELYLGFGDDIKNPMPWAIAQGVGMACKKYRNK